MPATSLSWKARRRGGGTIYCAPACGMGCTWQAYQLATARAKALAKRLGQGWVPRVWENLGWHYEAVWAADPENDLTRMCDGVRVSPTRYAHGKRVGYLAFVGRSYSHARATPEDALREAIADAEEDIARRQAWLAQAQAARRAPKGKRKATRRK